MTSSPPDLIRQWFIDHPGSHVRPADLARNVGVTVHVSANTCRRLLDTGELVRFRQPSQKGKSGPGVLYGAAQPYATATTLDTWTATRVAILANKKGARTP